MSSVDTPCGWVGARQQVSDLRSRFQLGKALGQGTYGKVRVARDRTTGEKVALKCIKKKKISTFDAWQRVRSEINIMKQLRHPNILQLIEVLETRDRIVLVLEYAAGGELFDHIVQLQQSDASDEDEVRRLFRQITSAVHHCHQLGIAHRDLKLENILLDGKKNVKLADFGLACSFKGDRLLEAYCGSPLYASPEIVNSTPYSGPEVDCWSLGVVLYTLVHGAMPFGGDDTQLLRENISTGTFYDPQLYPAASQLITQLLEPNAKARADTALVLNAPWLRDGQLSRADDVLDLSIRAEHTNSAQLGVGPEQPTTPRATEAPDADDEVFCWQRHSLLSSRTGDSGVVLDESWGSGEYSARSTSSSVSCYSGSVSSLNAEAPTQYIMYVTQV